VTWRPCHAAQRAWASRTEARFGGGAVRGLDDEYKNFPGGEECFCRFPSCGNAGAEPGESIGRRMKGRLSLLQRVYCFGYGFQSKISPFPAG
jgi:hypothetical protein